MYLGSASPIVANNIVNGNEIDIMINETNFNALYFSKLPTSSTLSVFYIK
ncbi:hypothetical protein QO7_2412 [Clostridioides difficile F314]|nr:hypothetical protein QO7_2412 [Clostridioides difficile F314]